MQLAQREQQLKQMEDQQLSYAAQASQPIIPQDSYGMQYAQPVMMDVPVLPPQPQAPVYVGEPITYNYNGPNTRESRPLD